MGIEEKKQQRAAFLLALYRAVGGRINHIVDQYVIGEGLGFDRVATGAIVTYFRDRAYLGAGYIGPGISLSSHGALQAETLLPPAAQAELANHRTSLLRSIYEAADGNPRRYVALAQFAPQLGFTDDQVRSAADHLNADGLIELQMGPSVGITAQGVDTVESS